jgi:hypothetical protein
MPNGKPGDHAYTDVVNHRMTVFGPTIDGLIREIAETGGGDEKVWSLLYENDPRWRNANCDEAAVEESLRRILASRQRDG